MGFNPSSGSYCHLERCKQSNNTINGPGCFFVHCQINICFNDNELELLSFKEACGTHSEFTGQFARAVFDFSA